MLCCKNAHQPLRPDREDPSAELTLRGHSQAPDTTRYAWIYSFGRLVHSHAARGPPWVRRGVLRAFLGPNFFQLLCTGNARRHPAHTGFRPGAWTPISARLWPIREVSSRGMVRCWGWGGYSITSPLLQQCIHNICYYWHFTTMVVVVQDGMLRVFPLSAIRISEATFGRSSRSLFALHALESRYALHAPSSYAVRYVRCGIGLCYSCLCERKLRIMQHNYV